MDWNRRAFNIGLSSVLLSAGRGLAKETDDISVVISTSIGQLEEEANNLALPTDTVITRAGLNKKLGKSNFYADGLPRLLNLFSRSEKVPEFNNKVAGQISRLNLTQREIPEQFDTTPGKKAIKKKNALKTFALDDLATSYITLFDACEIRQDRREEVNWYLSYISKYKESYVDAGNKASVPWYFIAIIHALEASFNFKGHLHNGDPLTSRTTHIPVGKPKAWLPPSDWASSATDALSIMGFTNQSDWTLPTTLYRLEKYNGMGYRRRGIVSPYLWSFSNHYVKGKYRKDKVYDGSLVSQQCGAGVMLLALEQTGKIELAR